MADEETRDVYRLKKLEEFVEKVDERLDEIVSRQQSTEEWKARQEERAKEDREEAKKWRDQLRTAFFLLAVSITSGVLIALLTTGKL